MIGQWTPVDPKISRVHINGARRQQSAYCKTELEQIKTQCRTVLGPNPTRHDIVNYFYGPCSPLYTVFRDRLDMNHKTFLDFMATNNTLAEGSSTSQLYDTDFPHPDVVGLLAREEFTSLWSQISKEGVPEIASLHATSGLMLWEETEGAVNKSLGKILIEGRSGPIINLLDDDKHHHESHPSKNKHMNVKIMKFVNDNRWGVPGDTLCNVSLLIPINIRFHRRRTTQSQNTQAQLYGSAYGNDPTTPPNLGNILLHVDRGFSFESQQQKTFAPAKLKILCTTARGAHLAFNYGQTPSQNDRRIIFLKVVLAHFE